MSVEEANLVVDEVRRWIHEDPDTGSCVIQIEAAQSTPSKATDTDRIAVST